MKEGQSHSFLAQPRSKTIRLSLLRFTFYKHWIHLWLFLKHLVMKYGDSRACLSCHETSGADEDYQKVI